MISLRDKAKTLWTAPLILLALFNILHFFSRDTRLFFDMNHLSGVKRPSGVDHRFAELRRLLPERGTVGVLPSWTTTTSSRTTSMPRPPITRPSLPWHL